MSNVVLDRPQHQQSNRSHPPSKTLLYSLLTLMVFFWSLNFIIAKVALREFPPLLLAGLRVGLAGLMIWPAYFWNARKQARRTWTRSDFPVLLCLGLFGVALNQLFFVVGVSRTSVAHGAIILGTTPIIVLCIAAGIGMEKLTPAKLIGMAVALVGVGVLNTAPNGGTHPTATGDILVLLGAVAFALFTVIGKRSTSKHGGLTVTTFAYVGGGAMLLPVTLWYSATFPYSQVSLAGWASLTYMAAFPSIVAYLIFYYALTHIPASRVSSFTYLQPMFATVLAIPLLNESLTPAVLGGGVLVFLGVYLAERK